MVNGEKTPLLRALVAELDVEKLRIPDAELALVVSSEEPEGTALLLESNENPTSKTYQEVSYQAGLPEIVFFVEIELSGPISRYFGVKCAGSV